MEGLVMITIYCSYFSNKTTLIAERKPVLAKEFLTQYRGKFCEFIGALLREEKGETVDMITHVIGGLDKRYSYVDDGVDLYFGIHANPPRVTQMGADQLYGELVSSLRGSGFSQLGIKMRYVAGIYHGTDNEVLRKPRPYGTERLDEVRRLLQP